MQRDEARILLGFPPDSRPTLAQIKEAYRKKVWESHPDLFPGLEKPKAESKFKLVSEAYNSLLNGLSLQTMTGSLLDDYMPMVLLEKIGTEYAMFIAGYGREGSASGTYSRVVRTGVPQAGHGGRGNHALIRIPFLLIILGTVGLGGLNASRAYKKQKEAYPSHNPFLP